VAIGEIGPEAVSAVPVLIALLADSDEGSRDNAYIALSGIGPAVTPGSAQNGITLPPEDRHDRGITPT
jgi:HEAT repeat protein